ncbi:MAG: hypothetical protein WC866_05995 [Patescibacteria group bacterium]|jgi:hypothetical protein
MIQDFLKRILSRPRKDRPRENLDIVAAAMVFKDPENAHCWELVRVGIQTKKLGLGNLERWIAHLRAGNGMGADEFSIDIDEPPAVGRVVVQILDDMRTCPALPLIEALERLREAAERQEKP